MTAYILRNDTTRDGVYANLLKVLAALDNGKSWEIDVKQWRKTRTNDQCAALFGLAYKTIRDATGNDFDDLHTYFCGEYFGWKQRDVMGMRRMVPIRTTTTDTEGRKAVMSTTEFADFFAFIQARAAQTQGIYIADPDPFWREQVAQRVAG